MLNDYFNMNDKKDTKDYYLSLTGFGEVNNLVIGYIPEEIKPHNKLINRK